MAAERAKVYLVGAGPGDPDLLTRKGARILAQAEAVIYDKFVSPEILALANPHATFIPARKQHGHQEEFQAEIHAWYLRLRDAAGPVVRLTSGDPLVFGRGGEELEFLTQHGFDVEVVPGVSALTAAPSLAGIPLGGFSRSGDGATGASASGERSGLAGLPACGHAGGSDGGGTSRGDRHLPDPWRAAGQRSGRVPAISSTERERVIETTLEQVARGEVEVEPPAVFVIGEVVRLRTAPGAANRKRGQTTLSPIVSS